MNASPSLHGYLDASIEVLHQTIRSIPNDRMERAIDAVTAALGANRAVLVCGNGGSAADAEHITGELAGRFYKERRGFKVICLTGTPALLTAWANDYSYETVFSRQVEAYGEPGGVLLGLSTSGNSPNVVAAFAEARARGITTIALTGDGGGRLGPLSDHLLAVPSRCTPLIQQVHTCLYHYLCERVEADLSA